MKKEDLTGRVPLRTSMIDEGRGCDLELDRLGLGLARTASPPLII